MIIYLVCLIDGKKYVGSPSTYKTAGDDDSGEGCKGCIANQNLKLCHSLPECWNEEYGTDLIFKEESNEQA